MSREFFRPGYEPVEKSPGDASGAAVLDRPSSAETGELNRPRAIKRYLAYLSNDKGSSENTIAAYRNDLSQMY